MAGEKKGTFSYPSPETFSSGSVLIQHQTKMSARRPFWTPLFRKSKIIFSLSVKENTANLYNIY